jgi:NADH-quinone oxidoreductase subunit N
METLNLSYSAIAPEIIASVTGVLIMLIDAFSKNGARKANATVSLIGLGAVLVSIVGLWSETWTPFGVNYFSGMVVVDHLRLFFSVIVTIVAIISVLLAGQFLSDEALPPGEFFSLIMFATAGMLMMVSAGDLVMVFLGLETTSIATYILAGYRKYDVRANESSLKYFLLGSFSTAFLLYGMALVYGATATTNIDKIRLAIANDGINNPQLLLIGAALMLVGFGFKIASAPFHLWTPDVYEGAPTIVTAFMATGPKAAVFAAFLRVFTVGLNEPSTGVGSQLHLTWVTVLAVIAVLTMTIGNVIALSQRNIKRMLAYSSIAHAGYALVGFITGDYAPVGFYLLTYAVMNLGAFAVILVLARAGDRKTEIGDYAGIGFEVPALSFSLTIFLLSLAGIPPMGGFISKFFVFRSAWELMPGLRWLVIIAVINSIISVYYYLYPIVVMFFRPLPTGFIKPRVSAGVAVALIITLAGVFYLGLMPNRILSVINKGRPAAVRAEMQPLNR